MGEVIEVIPEEETASESANMSKLCIGLDHTITPASSTVTGITMTTRPATSDITERIQLVTNTTLKITQGQQYTYIAIAIQTYTGSFI